jgi:hypothetical protein
VDRRKGGRKRSTATDATGIPPGIASAGPDRHDSLLLEPALTATAAEAKGGS